jgi:hypothetical protein
MQKTHLIIAGLITVFSLILSTSCEKEGGENETVISNTNGTSHHTGDNCMTCHKSGGSGEGWFQLAGTIYNSTSTSPYANATIKLYRDANITGALVATISADKSGNFYTTSSINFGSGLFVSIANTNETILSMNSPITSGACNSCHSGTASQIKVP